jgi:hypothetical protein
MTAEDKVKRLGALHYWKNRANDFQGSETPASIRHREYNHAGFPHGGKDVRTGN